MIQVESDVQSGQAQETMGRWFSDNGCLLFIEHQAHPDDSEVRPLRDAVLLDEHDDLLRCVDAWLAQAHDWQPVDSPESMPHFQVTLRTLSEPSRQVSLVLQPPVDNDGQVDSPSNAGLRVSLPSEWRSFVAVSHQEHCASLVMDTVTLGAGDTDRLASGSLVVLPASFEPQWAVRLETFEPGPGQFLSARLDADTGLLDVAPSAYELASWQGADAVTGREITDETSAARSAQRGMRVVLQKPVSINTQACEEAWTSGANVQLAPLGDVSRLGVRLSMSMPAESDSSAIDDTSSIDNLSSSEGASLNEKVWTGSLLRVGRGFGVILDSDVATDDAS